MGWIGCVRCEQLQCDFMAQTCALILPFLSTLHQVSCINERIQNAPKHYKTHQNMSLRSNGCIGFVRCQKFRCNFMAQTFALIAPVQPVLHRVSCSNKAIQNTPKEFTVQWVDRVRSLPKIPMRLHGMNFCINYSSSPCFEPSFMQ